MIITLLLTLLFFAPTEPTIMTCTIVKIDQSVACPEEAGMSLFTFIDETEARSIFDEWRIVAPLQGDRVNTDAPMGTKTLKVGDKVKAVIEDGKFRPIAECHVRIYRNVKFWRQGREGERVPNILFTLPDDCQPPARASRNRTPPH